MRFYPKDGSGEARGESEAERLERAVAEEREHSAALLAEVQDLKFKREILERSYIKQLEVARLKAESAEKALVEQRTRNAELDALRADAIQLLTDTQAEIDKLTAERNQFRRQLSARGGYQVEGAGDEPADDDGGGTINTLLNDASWLKRKKPAEEARLKAEAERRKAEEEQTGDMLDPQLVLAPGRRKD
jgi:DNA repair exonuclease SbcCD ATPase subunit